MTSIQIDIKDGLSSSVAIKGPCVVATTANITLSGEQTIDGVAVVTDDRVLVKDQTTGADNGVYIVDTGAWRRSKDFNKTKDIKTGTLVNVVGGATNAGLWEVTTTGDITVGTTSIAFALAVSLSTGVSGTLPIAHGGTGQSTASTAFNALSPTTTRGDLIFRNATTNARLAASTAGYHLQTNGAGTDPIWAGFVQSGTGASTRTWQDKNRERVSVKDFGATGDGTTDDTTAIANAIASLASGGIVWFPRGTYKVTSQLNITVSGICLRGEGRGAVTISSSASGHTIQIATGLSYVEIRDMQITRPASAYPAISGQDGIHFTNLTERALVDNVEVSRHWEGIRCGITGFSKITNNLINNCYSNGILVTNADGAGGLQWTLINNLTQQCNGWGVRYQSPSGTASVGEIINHSTYANKLGGMAFTGTDASHALNAIRIRGGFVGQDGSDEIYFDTYGSSSTAIIGVFAELAGTSVCGVDTGTAATNVGHGINLTANNTEVSVANCTIIGNSYSGIASNAARILITGNNIRINGAAASPGETSGILINAGNATITANSSKGQAFGMFLTNDGPHVAVGNDLTENTTASFAAGATLTNSVVQDNIPKAGNDLGQRFGTSTNDSARAGNVGEYIESVVATGSAVALTTNTQANVTSISLTAGDWDIDAIAQFKGATTTNVSSQEASISTTSATLDYTNGRGIGVTGNATPYNQIAATSSISLPIPPLRLSLSATTTVYLVARSIFTVSTSSVYGIIRARRVR